MADETREQQIRARVNDDGKRTAYYVGPFVPNLAIDDLAYLLEENQRLRKIMAADEDIAGEARVLHLQTLLHLGEANQERDQAQADLAAARAEVERLQGELLKRGRHLPACAWLSCIEAGQRGHDAMARMVRDGCPDCDCGWEAERAALAREDGDGR